MTFESSSTHFAFLVLDGSLCSGGSTVVHPITSQEVRTIPPVVHCECASAICILSFPIADDFTHTR
jgi:hypothetical protein